MAKDGWDRFEWDDENKKNGNVQHLRDHDIEPEEAEECFFHDYVIAGDNRRFDDVTSWMEEPIMGDDLGLSFRTKEIDLPAYLPAGN